MAVHSRAVDTSDASSVCSLSLFCLFRFPPRAFLIGLWGPRRVGTGVGGGGVDGRAVVLLLLCLPALATIGRMRGGALTLEFSCEKLKILTLVSGGSCLRRRPQRRRVRRVLYLYGVFLFCFFWCDGAKCLRLLFRDDVVREDVAEGRTHRAGAVCGNAEAFFFNLLCCARRFRGACYLACQSTWHPRTDSEYLFALLETRREMGPFSLSSLELIFFFSEPGMCVVW